MAQTKFDKFCDSFTSKNIKGMFVLFACFLGALSLFWIPNIFSGKIDAGDGDKTSQGMYDEYGRHVPTGEGVAVGSFGFREVDSALEVGKEIKNLLIISDEDAITEWSVSNTDVAEVTFFPFIVKIKAVGDVEISIKVNRVINGVTNFSTARIELVIT